MDYPIVLQVKGRFLPGTAVVRISHTGKVSYQLFHDDKEVRFEDVTNLSDVEDDLKDRVLAEEEV